MIAVRADLCFDDEAGLNWQGGTDLPIL